MKQTENYQLNQWEKDDRIQMEDFNSDNAKIDAALAAAGNCHIITGSYVGTGTYGEDNPNSLTFPFPPQVIFMHTTYVNDYNSVPQYYIFYRGAATGFAPGSSSKNKLTWDGNTVSWYHTDKSYGPKYQFNTADQTYYYVAIG